jgi:hypothetical protein
MHLVPAFTCAAAAAAAAAYDYSLALVGDVPEFREGRSRLAALEDRLQRRVEGRLADALQVIHNLLLPC